MIQLLLAFSTIFCILIIMWNLLDKKIPIKEYLKIGAITYFFSLIGLKYEFLVTPIIIISISIQLKLKGRSAFYSIIPPFISVFLTFVGNNVGMYITTNIFKVGIYDINIYRSTFWLYMIPYILTILIGLFLSKIIAIIMNKYIRETGLKITLKKMIPLLFILVMTLIVFLVMMFSYDFKIFDDKVVIFNLVVYILYFGVTIFVMKLILKSTVDDVKKTMEKENLQNLVEYTNTLEVGYNEMRNFRHDYMNIITSIGGYINDDDVEGLKTFFNDKILPLNSTFDENNLTLSKLKNIYVVEAKAIISSKLIRAQDLGITVQIDILDPIEKIEMNMIDLCRVLGILLDNAMEGAWDSVNPILRFGIIKDEKQISIIVENSHSNEIVSISKLYEKGFSTKGENRGLGLGIYKDIISKYPNVLSKTKNSQGEFLQRLDIIENK